VSVLSDCLRPYRTVKAGVAEAFGRAAGTYADHAELQREVALRLARSIAPVRLPAAPLVLEIGCGTGFLTEALRERLPGARWFVSDLSETMVLRCRDNLGRPDDAVFLAMDGERPCLAPRRGFDLICSSLAFQWFDDLGPALLHLAELLAPGGELAFACLAADSLAEWRRAHRERGLAAATPDYPSLDDLDRMVPRMLAGGFTEEKVRRHYKSGYEFLAGLKAIGAHRSASGRPSLPPGRLRPLLRDLSPPQGITITFHIAYGRFRSPGEGSGS
jgi:malonyl-CoA O-methyltransferase